VVPAHDLPGGAVTPGQWERVLHSGAATCRLRAADEDLRKLYPDGSLMLSALAFGLDALADEAAKIAQETA
jgi:hypothetical protein